MSLKRAVSWMAVLASIAAVVGAFTLWSLQSTVVPLAPADGEMRFSSERRMIWPGTCTELSWSASPAQQVFLDGLAVPTNGAQHVCPRASRGYTLRAVLPDGTSRQATIPVRVFLTTLNTRAGAAAAAVLIALWVLTVAVVGDLPWLSARLRALRVAVQSKAKRYWRLALEARHMPRDLAYLSALALVAALPLIVLRYVAEAHTPGVILLIIAVWLGVLLRWLRAADQSHAGIKRLVPRSASRGHTRSPRRAVMVAVLLLVFAIAFFYVPMRTQFWMGGDEIRVLEDGMQGWSVMSRYDQAYSRPLTPLGSILAVAVTPDSVFGFLWMAVALRFLGGALVYGVLRQLIPGGELIALASAVLFIVNPSEPTRFLAVYMQGYNTGVFLLLLSLYTYLRSARSANRWLLIISCAFLLGSLFVVEAGALVSLLWPLLLWWSLHDRRNFPTWAYAWLVTLGLFAVRFVQYRLTSSDTYQSTLAGSHFDVGTLASNLVAQLKPAFRYLSIPHAPPTEWLCGVAAFVIVALVFRVVAPSPGRPAHRTYLLGLVGAASAIVLSVAPYLPINGILATVRTQFYAAPAQASGWALLIGLAGSYFARPFWRIWVASATGLLAALSVVSGMSWDAHRPINPRVEYEKTVSIVQQVLRLAPAVKPDTLVGYVFEDDETPLGWNYHVIGLTRFILGVDGYPLNYTDSLGIRYELAVDAEGTSCAFLDYTCDELVVFEISRSGEVALLRTLPTSLLPADNPAIGARYDPVARILTTDVEFPRFFERIP